MLILHVMTQNQESILDKRYVSEACYVYIYIYILRMYVCVSIALFIVV